MRRLALATAALLLAQAAAAAEEPRQKASDVLKEEAARPLATPISDRFAIRASYFPASLNTDLRLDDSAGNPGTPLSGEDDLGLRSKLNQARIELLLRMRERHRVRVDFFDLTRRGDALMSRSIAFGDQVFNADERVISNLDWRMLNFTYLYSAVHRERFELGVGAGIHLLEGEARARVPARLIREDQSGAIAFPTFALDATLRIAQRFSLNARANYLRAHLNGSTGIVNDYHADLQYRWRRTLAVGLGYQKMKTHLEIVDSSNLAGNFVLKADGPELFFRASF